MMELDRRREVDWCLGKIQIFAAIAVAAFGAVLKADPARSGVLESTVCWMHDTAWIVVVVGPVFIAGIQGFRRKFGNPWAWEAIQRLLDQFRNDVFEHLNDDPLDHHRVTLFKYRRVPLASRLPKDGWQWLGAVARSGHLTKEKIRRFRASDDGERCQGVVGMAWRRRTWVIVPKVGKTLPVLTRGSSDSDIEAYARETNVESDLVKKQLVSGKPLASSYAALVVRLKGKPWGVLVLDSRGEGPMDRERLQKFSVYGDLLTPLLERV